MRINFLVNPVFQGWEPTDDRLGGTERGVVEWAEELVKCGHHVQVFRNHRIWESPTDFMGVAYVPRELYKGGGDACINIKSSEVPPKEPTIYYTNEIDAGKKDLSAYGAVIHISQWAVDNIPVNNPNVFIVPHGYDETRIYPGPKVPKQCLYASSPDRGLNTLLRAWLKVVRAHPDATLLVTYGAEGPEIPGVSYMGDLDEEQMDSLYQHSDYWVYPCEGIELQCITGLKAQAAGCWPVIIPHMALAETVKYGTFTTKNKFANDLIWALDGHPKQSYQGTTIKQSTDKLLEVIDFVLDGHNN